MKQHDQADHIHPQAGLTAEAHQQGAPEPTAALRSLIAVILLRLGGMVLRQQPQPIFWRWAWTCD